MRLATVLASISTLLLTIPTAKAQDFCATGYSVPINFPMVKKGIPFTAMVKLTFDQKLADGNAIHGEAHYHIARDASGTIMIETPMGCSLGDDGQMHQTFNVLVRSGNTQENWRLNDDQFHKIATISHFPDPVKPSEAELAGMRARARSHPPQITEQTEKLGTREFLNITANGVRTIQTIPAGQQGNALPLLITNESWVSPQFGIMMTISEDPRRGRGTSEIVELHQGDLIRPSFPHPRITSSKSNPSRHQQLSSALPPRLNNRTVVRI
jgi:hypothetical protein